MYTTKNLLRNTLDKELAKKIIYLFLQNETENNPTKLPIKNLAEESFEVFLSHKKEHFIITLKLIIQEECIKDPTKGGCPTNYYQYVEEINFSSKNKNVVAEVQENFKLFLQKEEELPISFVRNIEFNY